MTFAKSRKCAVVCFWAFALPLTASAADQPHVGPVTKYFRLHVEPWLSVPFVIDSLKRQNARNARLTTEDITRLDSQWIGEVESDRHPMIDKSLTSAISLFLTARADEAGGTITEIILMDENGLNVGQSSITSDYWQGDEDKFTKSFGAGPHAIFVDDARQDESTQTFQAQISATITNETGKPIGAITVGINLDQL